MPTSRDEMMDERVKGKTRFKASATGPTRPTSRRRWARRRCPARCWRPRPATRSSSTSATSARRRSPCTRTASSTRPTWTAPTRAASRSPGGFVKPGETFRYVWDCRRGHRGRLALPRPRAAGPAAALQGAVRAVILAGEGRAAGRRRPLHRLPLADPGGDRPARHVPHDQRPRLRRQHADARAKVGQRVAQHVVALDNDFHTYHLHGHRWTDPNGRVVDNVTLGPADSYSLEFVEDNPGRWFYHCHVFSHLHEGMNGWYVVVALSAAAAAARARRGRPRRPARRRLAQGRDRRLPVVAARRHGRPRRHRHLVWVGPGHPALGHRVSANAAGIDSDPGNGAPDHAPGDRVHVRFDQPGIYELHCKLHAIVRGTVTVVDEPGTGRASPDPDPQVRARPHGRPSSPRSAGPRRSATAGRPSCATRSTRPRASPST